MDIKKSTEKKKYPGWYYLLLVVIPLGVLFLLEVSLRLFNYGEDKSQWLEIGDKKLTLNYNIARRYFPTVKNAPVVLSSQFDKIKKKNAFRVFVIGESSAAGFPYLPNGSFSNYLEQRLKIVYPDVPIEIVNTGITAINSYAWLDLIDGIIDQKPDLIIIYGGHNEYYGALGAASTESFGSSGFLIKLSLWLNKFKTTELIRNAMQSVVSLFAKQSGDDTGTLMAKLSKGQQIVYQSELFTKGILQFENNVKELLSRTRESNIPVILSTLVSNCKDQKPFVSAAVENLPSADNVYSTAKQKLATGKTREADSLFRLAKDLDLLKFRAPEAMNHIIKKLGEVFDYPVADVDSLFRNESAYNLIGDSLMTDHLHPTLKGYQLMGKMYFDVMKEEDLLPKHQAKDMDDFQQDTLTKRNFLFSELDSRIADYRIKNLKNDWPYKARVIEERPQLNSIIDSLAYSVGSGRMGWGDAHKFAGEYYLRNRQLDLFIKEYDILINIFPDNLNYYDRAAKVLIVNTQYDRAYKYLKPRYDIEPGGFTAKWLGFIEMQKKNNRDAIKYFEKGKSLTPDDPDIYYYLTGAYGRVNRIDKALESINKCLQLKPDYPRGKALLQFVKNQMNQKKSTN